MPIIPSNHAKLLTEFAKSKRLVAVVVKGRRDFFFNLEGLAERRPEDVGLLAFVPKESNLNGTVKLFDAIIPYDDSKSLGKEFRSFEDIEIPELDPFTQELVSFVPKEKVCMIHCEENSIGAVCRTRKRFALTGAYPEHALYMGRKDKVHEIALQAGIPQPRSTYVSLFDGKTKEEILELVTSAIPTFPLFRKPKMLMGLRGVGKVESEEELNRWITERMAEGDQETYIFQEFVSGTEFTISTVLLQDGSWVPLVIKHVAFEWSHHECISTGKPVVSIVEPFEEAQKESFPGMYDFTKKIIETFKPPHPQVFCFQGFQRTPRKDDYVLNELAYRPAGERVNTLCYQACGVNQYTALILASIDPSYIPKPSHSSQRKLITGIWYPKREGTLLEHQEFPKRPNIKGTITGEWHVPIGTKMEKARNMGHMVATMFLESASKGERNEDIKWISENWTPVVKA